MRMNTASLPYTVSLSSDRPDEDVASPRQLRVALFGSFHGGRHVLDILLRQFPRAIRVVGVATDNPRHPFTNAPKRLWKYPHTPEEETLVTALAEEHGLPVFTGRVKTAQFHRVFAEEWRPELCLMATFGQLIPAHLISFPSLGFFNFHHSDEFWPSYPGPDPIRDMLADGKTQAFLNMHRVTEVLDGGELIARSPAIEIGPGTNAVEVHRRSWAHLNGFITNEVYRLVRARDAVWPPIREERFILV